MCHQITLLVLVLQSVAAQVSFHPPNLESQLAAVVNEVRENTPVNCDLLVSPDLSQYFEDGVIIRGGPAELSGSSPRCLIVIVGQDSLHVLNSIQLMLNPKMESFIVLVTDDHVPMHGLTGHDFMRNIVHLRFIPSSGVSIFFLYKQVPDIPLFADD